MVRPTQFLLPNSSPDNTTTPISQQSIAREGTIAGVTKAFTEKDSAYGELALTNSTNSFGDSTLKNLDWQCERPVELLKNLKRLTAPNPGVMTGPGTNTYILGTELTGYIVIDPGPLDTDHSAGIFKACKGDIRMIVCTHSHADHSPGALPLQRLCENGSRSKPPILGLASQAHAKPSAQFKPDRELMDGECLELSYANVDDPSKSQTHTLEVVFTPGHAANHVCFVLKEDSLLFSGDHVLNGSTTIVDPPDGNMGQYLASLKRLEQLCQAHKIEFIFPAHGFVLGNYSGRPRSAVEVIQNIYDHRMKRESKILKVVQQDPSGSLDDWVKKAYDDVPESVWPIAKRSLWAHVENLQELGLIK